MKCLYCAREFEEEKDLRKHYENEHNANSKNFFLPNVVLKKKI